MRRTLEYFGLADADEGEPVETRELVESLARRVEENSEEIAALRAEVARLRERG